jgi:hypothetical protein
VALSRSESIPVGSIIEFTVLTMGDVTEDILAEAVAVIERVAEDAA